MHMHLDTTNREAFELVTDALQSIDRYRVSRDIGALDLAQKKLVSALEKDPHYFRASYYDAIVDDLAGRPAKAVTKLEKLIDEAPPFVDEVRYNLGVAEFHNYGLEALDRAIAEFSAVIRSTNDQTLRLRAKAGLAQANAMHLIPKEPDKPDIEGLQLHFDAAMTAVDEVLRDLHKHRRRWFASSKEAIPRETADEIEWTAENARGIALMYYSDYFPPKKEPQFEAKRIRKLRQAIRTLDRADSLSPRNWALYCNRASARMRLGYYATDIKLFDEALAMLKVVVEQIRPGYAFAIYEMGRVLRLRGDFKLAADHFEKVLAVPREDRDISDRRPKIELERAKHMDKSFP